MAGSAVSKELRATTLLEAKKEIGYLIHLLDLLFTSKKTMNPLSLPSRMEIKKVLQAWLFQPSACN